MGIHLNNNSTIDVDEIVEDVVKTLKNSETYQELVKQHEECDEEEEPDQWDRTIEICIDEIGDVVTEKLLGVDANLFDKLHEKVMKNVLARTDC